MYPEIRKTNDGSHTLFVPSLNEHYHSTFGAIAESQHIFIDAGLKFVSSQKTKINILEVGFGTGLNALLTLINAQTGFINYVGIEAFPLSKNIISQLNYPDLLDAENAKSLFVKIHDAEWEMENQITDFFNLKKIHASILEFNLSATNFDLVYFDAFAPEVQPEMWEAAVFKKIFDAMKSGGILVTYSSKGLVKRNLKEAGFILERLPGPAGKRHILRARKG